MQNEIDEPLYLIWSIKANGWWKDNGFGFTLSHKDAGLFSHATALELCRLKLQKHFPVLYEDMLHIEP